MQSRSRSTFIFPWQPNPSNKLAIIHILGLLSNLFTTLDISHHDDDHESTEVKKLPVQQGPNPVVVVLQQVFQLIQKVLSKWLNDAQVVESVCAIFEKSVKTLLDDFAPMVPQLCEMLGQMYSTIPQASAIDLTRQVGARVGTAGAAAPGEAGRVQDSFSPSLLSLAAGSHLCS